MGRQVAVLVLAGIIAGCAYNPPKEANAIESVAINVPQALPHVWDRALAALTESGYTITTASKEAGIISTGEKLLTLNETQADCGNIWGIPYTKDRRTQTHAAYSLHLTNGSPGTRIVIASRIRGSFVAHAGAQATQLSCRSLGHIENSLAAKLK